MICRDLSFESPEKNILYDDALLFFAEKYNGPEVLRFWESPEHFIVLGRIGKIDEEIKKEAIKKDSIPVVRRASGGGTVVQGKGCLNYSLILSKELHPQIGDLKGSYSYILGKVISALNQIGVEACFYPISDIALIQDQKKISGNAQRRLRNHILHHGTILYDFDLEKIAKYLRMPKSIPAYRKGRAHFDFVSNVPHWDRERFKQDLMKEFDAFETDNSLDSQEQRIFEGFQQEYKPLIY